MIVDVRCYIHPQMILFMFSYCIMFAKPSLLSPNFKAVINLWSCCGQFVINCGQGVTKLWPSCHQPFQKCSKQLKHQQYWHLLSACVSEDSNLVNLLKYFIIQLSPSEGLDRLRPAERQTPQSGCAKACCMVKGA